MSTKEDELECTCGFFAHPWIHHIDCQLWNDVDFTMGFKEWSPDEWELIESSYDSLGRTEEDWNVILDTEGTDVDAWRDEDGDVIEVMSDAEAEALMTWLQEHQPETPVVTEITDTEYASSDGPAPGVLKCFCFNEKKGTYCGPCGLTRTKVTDPWSPAYHHKEWLKKADRNTECMCVPQCSIHCEPSKLQRWSSVASYWVFWDADAADREASYEKWNNTSAFSKCRHYGKSVEFPDGTIVYASSSHTKKDEDLIPDLGIYMAGSWTPVSIAFHLGWQDFGLPTIPDSHVRFIVDQGIEWARGGSIVEVGCVGGHGRTGSVLALMALSCGINDPDKAIEWVRENYCEHAIEGKKQEWYVRKYHAILNGLPIPEQPVVVSTVVNKPAVIGTPQTSHTSGSGVKAGSTKDLVVVPPSAIGTDPCWEELMGWL